MKKQLSLLAICFVAMCMVFVGCRKKTDKKPAENLADTSINAVDVTDSTKENVSQDITPENTVQSDNTNIGNNPPATQEKPSNEREDQSNDTTSSVVNKTPSSSDTPDSSTHTSSSTTQVGKPSDVFETTEKTITEIESSTQKPESTTATETDAQSTSNKTGQKVELPDIDFY